MSVLNQSGDELVECPLCMEPLEVDDLNFFPCTCGYQICRFCWHRIRTDENGLCPACRKAYSENPADFKPLTKEELAKLKAEKRLKDQQRKQRVTENRKHLANVRVVQKNLVFVVGLPMRLADADVLKKHEYFGKFGKIHKVVINQSTSYAGSQGPSASAYVTYQRQEDALRAIEAVNNITVDGRSVKTSLGTTKYCSHFMRNQSCPKPDCMYLHDLGDQEASFTKEEMHQGKHQDYERKLVQSLHINITQRKPTPSPPVPGGITIGPNAQAKEAWPSLQPGQIKDTSSKESSPVQQTNNHSVENGVVVLPTNPAVIAGVQKQQLNNNNNNKGEIAVNARRGKSNNESKAQAARNKHKNSQNKEKHGSSSSSTRRAESNSNINQYGQKENTDLTALTSEQLAQKTRLKSEQCVQNNKTSVKLSQQVQELKISGIVLNGDQDCEELQHQREGGTPASTISSSEDSSSIISNSNQQMERLDANCEESMGNSTLVLLGTSPANSNTSQTQSHQHQQQSAPPGLHSTSNNNISSNQQAAHRSIFQSDNNSFFSSNSFQKLPANSTAPSTSQSGNIAIQDWTSGVIAPIPDSLPTVYSSEDWQAAFGFQTSTSKPTSVTDRTSISSSPKAISPAPPSVATRISFSNEDFTLDPDPPSVSSGSALVNGIASSILANTQAATQHFMSEFHQSSLQQRLKMQQNNIDSTNCSNINEYSKQNGHASTNEIQKQQNGESLKADDDLGFDPFHETQKALAELMENEIKLQQQRMFQQQQQMREREEHTRLQQQQNISGLGSHPFSQVNHLTHLQQAQQLQNFQVLQQSQQQQHSLLSRLPTPLLQQQQQQQQNGGTQSPVTVANLGQRSRLPPPGFPSSTPNHMNSFGLGIPRPAPNTNTLAGSKILPFVSHTSGVLFNGGQQNSQNSFLQNQNQLLGSQGISKCANDNWCDINSQSQQQQQFHHQPLYQKSNWNNYSAISDVNNIDPAIVSSRLLPFQTGNNTWQFPQAHASHNILHSAQKEQSVSATQHWAMQPPPGFATASPNVPLGVQASGSGVQAHTKFISAGSEIENI